MIDDIYDSVSLLGAMKKGNIASCIMGTYRDYELFMNEWGDVCWRGKGEPVVGIDRFFLDSKWKLKKIEK